MKQKVTFSQDGTMWSAEPVSNFKRYDRVRSIESRLEGRVCATRNKRTRLLVQFAHHAEWLEDHEIEHVNKKLAITPDPLITAAKKAYRASPVYALDKLLEEESRWKRKQTIARNKLEEVRDKISKLAKELATPTSSLFSQAKREERGGDK